MIHIFGEIFFFVWARNGHNEEEEKRKKKTISKKRNKNIEIK
jgi:hypothetical protein